MLGGFGTVVGPIVGAVTYERLRGSLLTSDVFRDLHMALAVSDYAYVLSEGRVALSGPAAQLREMREVRRVYLGL
jgi:ABC-type branched-subunit amino acid transport system ATPase component